MFFAAKIRGTGEALGINVRTARTTEKFFEKLKELKPAIVVVDLHSENCDPFEIAEKVKNDESISNVPLIGFFSHVHTELMQKA
jgi:PleD family two-component response regulator